MGLFDFITDERFRASLESDYSELQSALKEESWKSAHVLSGSIIEAVLADSLIAKNYTAADVMKMDLGQLVTKYKVESILSDRTEQLSTVVRGYRNLIHPGRQIREQEHADGNSATVSHSLVKMIIEEVEKKKSESYGWTAQQICSKVLNDPSTRILRHLLQKMNDIELERLVLKVIPDEYFSYLQYEGPSDTQIKVLINCYHEAFEIASDDTRRKAMQRFVELLENESSGTIANYQDAFFRSKYLAYVAPDRLKLVKQHLLGLVSSDLKSHRNILSDIAAHLDDDEIHPFVTSTVAAGLFDQENEPVVISFYRSESRRFRTAEQKRLADSYLKTFLAKFENHDEGKAYIQALLNVSPPDDDIPF